MRLLDNDHRRNKILSNVVVLILALLIFSGRDGTLRQNSTFDNALIDSFAPIQKSVTFLQERVKSFFTHYLANISASKSNLNLQEKILDLESQIFQYRETLNENRRLKELLKFENTTSLEKVLAQVVAWDTNSDYRVIRINKGAADGIQIQSPVVTSEGLVGYIFRLTDHFADVLTILDSSNRVDGLIQRIRSHGIIEGYNSSRCIMKYVTRIEPVILNDIIITSGLGNIYPKGIPLGKVVRIEKQSFGITQQIEIVPSVDFGRLEEVIILIPQNDQRKKKEWKALNNMGEEQGAKK